MKLQDLKFRDMYGIALIIALITTVIIGGILIFVLKLTPKGRTNYNNYESRIELEYNKARYDLVKEVGWYMDSIAPTHCLDPLELVDKCIEYDIDVCFVLAQGQKESHFGTQGLARKTNSVWNVFAFDGLKLEDIHEKGKYKSPNASIEPYLRLLTNRYLVDKTEYDLLVNYVDKDGKRYASDEHYEAALLNIYKHIRTGTNIDSCSQVVKKYKILLGK